MLFDTHAHLLDEKFDNDRERLIKELPSHNIGWVTECGSDMDTSIRAAALARTFRHIFAAVGVHPHDAKSWDAHAEKEIRALAGQPGVVAIGEIGLDYHYDFSPRDAQRNALERQLQLAQEAGLPVVIHSREATHDTLEVLRNFPAVYGIMHSFSGSVETMEKLVDMGYYIAFGGMVTFKNAKKPVESARRTPMERLLIETDCPYMTPVPHRGKRNEPKYVGLVAEVIANIRGVDAAEIEQATTWNARRVFGIEE